MPGISCKVKLSEQANERFDCRASANCSTGLLMYASLAMWRGFLCAFAISLVPAHLLFSASVFAFISKNYQERMIDVRVFDPNVVSPPDLAGAWLAANATPTSTVFVGSSFTFGFPLAAASSMPSQFARLERGPVLNASTIGVSIEGIERYFLCELKRRGLRVKAIVVEIPLINELSFMRSVMKRNLTRRAECAVGPALPLFWLIVTHPSWGWASNIFDPYTALDDKVPIGPIPPDYIVERDQFEAVQGALSIRIRQVIDEARLYADEVYAFITPASLERIGQGGGDAELVAQQIEFGQSVCKNLLGEKCIATADLSENPALFYNAAHLNRAGNGVLARRVARAIDAASR